MNTGGNFRAQHCTGGSLHLKSSRLYFTAVLASCTLKISPSIFSSYYRLFLMVSVRFSSDLLSFLILHPGRRNSDLVKERWTSGGSRAAPGGPRGLEPLCGLLHFPAAGFGVDRWTSSSINVLPCELGIVLALTFPVSF